MSQETKLNRIITQLYFFGHLRALHETEVFEPFWDETAKLMIMASQTGPGISKVENSSSLTGPLFGRPPTLLVTFYYVKKSNG